ncbi:hypothetical protein JB92DRAFT_2839112 [Gautieria morchelliformis]|nr:hypothetical protein JB92DRAFT_2839112 [Gautieria morchelliformis]
MTCIPYKEEPRDSYIQRKCNTVAHLVGALGVPSLIGVQGLLLARTYAISPQNQTVLGVLGLLILGAIINQVYLSVLDNCNPTSSQLNTMTLLATINDVSVILFDTGVVIVTILNSIQPLRLWSKGKALPDMGIYVLTITLAATITTKVLRPSIQDILGCLQNSFQAAQKSVHNAIVAEFENPDLSREDFNAENLEENVAHQEGQLSPEEAGSTGIELDEFPHTSGCPGDVEITMQIASGSGRMAEA